jgi:hypothetical protein
MAYLTRPASLAHEFGAAVAYVPKSPVPQLEEMLERTALEAAVLNWFWTGDE